jgi:hypothetical protein
METAGELVVKRNGPSGRSTQKKEKKERINFIF